MTHTTAWKLGNTWMLETLCDDVHDTFEGLTRDELFQAISNADTPDLEDDGWDDFYDACWCRYCDYFELS